MSVISSFYNETGTVTRRTTGSTTGGDTITTVGSYLGVRRPADETDKLYIANNNGQAECWYTDEDNDMKEGDLLTIGSRSWSVQGVITLEDLVDDSDSHLKAIIVR